MFETTASAVLEVSILAGVLFVLLIGLAGAYMWERKAYEKITRKYTELHEAFSKLAETQNENDKANALVLQEFTLFLNNLQKAMATGHGRIESSIEKEAARLQQHITERVNDLHRGLTLK